MSDQSFVKSYLIYESETFMVKAIINYLDPLTVAAEIRFIDDKETHIKTLSKDQWTSIRDELELELVNIVD